MTEGPKLTVDAIVFDGEGAVVLIRRGCEPFKGSLALPGGFVEAGECVEEACAREAMEETGLKLYDLRLVGVYSDPERDPRRHTVSVAYLAEADLENLRAGDDAASAHIIKNWRESNIAFDHKQIIEEAYRLWSEK